MKRTNNYAIMTRQAQERFLLYDQRALIRKLNLPADGSFLYPELFGRRYRLDRETGNLQRQEGDAWADANTFEEVLTLLDLICDSREDRHVTGRYRTTQSFGQQFHQSLVEDKPTASALAFDKNPEGLKNACLALGGKPFPGADVGYILPVFGELTLVLQFWLGDEEFAPRVRYLWDEGAAGYLRYETMYYAIGVLEELLLPMV